MRGFSRFALIGLIAGLVAACTSTPKEEIFNNDGLTTEQIFSGTSSRAEITRHYYGWSDGNMAPYTRNQDTELANRFPELRNRRLNLYIFPHITPKGEPVPGYTTSFYLYDHARIFALPGEALIEAKP